MTNSYELYEARRANITDHQIGGVTDGITEEVAADLGFETHDRFLEIRGIGSVASEAERPQDIRIDTTAIVEGRPKTPKERAFVMAKKARQRESDRKTLDEMYADMRANEGSLDDNREIGTPPTISTPEKPVKKPTIAEQNANEAKHLRRAKKDRWGK